MRYSRDAREPPEWPEARKTSAGAGRHASIAREADRRLEPMERESFGIQHGECEAQHLLGRQPADRRTDRRTSLRRISGGLGGQAIERIPRLRRSGRHHIQYRHIIDSLVRKPGAFAQYRYQSDLFPGVLFRVAYDYLREHDPGGADRQYVRILHLAASESEQRVDEALRCLIERGETITADRVGEWVQSPVGFDCRDIKIAPVDIAVYDSLLEQAVEVPA